MKFLKGPKNAHYLKGLVHVLCKNLEFFLIGVFCRNYIRKDRFWYCGKKWLILSGKIEVIKRAEKYTFSKGVSPWISSKNRTFSFRCFFTELMSEEIVFGYFGKKTIIFRPKIEVLTMAKKCTFFREVSPWILSKNRTFSYRRSLQKPYQKTSFLILWKQKNDI